MTMSQILENERRKYHNIPINCEKMKNWAFINTVKGSRNRHPSIRMNLNFRKINSL